MSPKYVDNHKEIFILINNNNIEVLQKKYPAVIKHLDFIHFMINMYIEEYHDNYASFLVHDYFIRVLWAADNIYAQREKVFKEKELIKSFYVSQEMDDYLTFLFNPKKCLCDPGTYTFRMHTFMWADLNEKEVHNERIKKLFDIMKLVKSGEKFMCDSTVELLILKCHMLNNYDLLFEFVENRDYYMEKFEINGYERIKAGYGLLMPEADKLFNDLDKLLVKAKRPIR